MSRPLEQTPGRASLQVWRVLLPACLLFGLAACGEGDEEPAGPAAVVAAEKENEREKQEREKQEREKQEREKQEREKQEREKQEREKQEREKQEREKREREKHEREKHEREKHEREKHEREKHEREKHEREKREREERAKTRRFSIGGQVSGLASGRNIMLRTASGEELVVDVNGAFRFTRLLMSGETYRVEIARQPFWQFCEVRRGAGQAMSSISGVEVLCANAVAEVTTLAGSGAADFADGQGQAASFNRPAGLAIDGRGNVYVADHFNHRIRKITPAGEVTTLAGSRAAGFGDGTGVDASFSQPAAVAVDHQGHVYVADSGNHRIRKITPEGRVTTLAGSGTGDFADGLGVEASFAYPTGVTVDHQGQVYVADRGNHRVRKITPEGRVTTLAGSGTQGFADGRGVSASFAHPFGVTVDHQGHVYVADSSNHRIRKITPEGRVTTLAGSGMQGFADGPGVSASFAHPFGMTVDHQGHVYVADNLNHRIRKIMPEGKVTTLAGSGIKDFADKASFVNPTGVTVDHQGHVYVADSRNHRIRKIIPMRAR